MTMHDADDEMTRAFRDSLKQALEQQVEINARLDNLTAKFDQVIARNKTLTVIP